MKRIFTIITASAFCLSLFTACNTTEKDKTPNIENTEKKDSIRIVSLNGAVTEILVDLGLQGDIVGTDVTSTFPESLKETAKDLGHVRKLTAESVLALNPGIILGTTGEINPELTK